VPPYCYQWIVLVVKEFIIIIFEDLSLEEGRGFTLSEFYS